MANLFLSYSRRDEPVVQKLRSDLKACGYPVWIDQEKILGGHRWRIAIDDAIELCRAVVLVASKNAFRSENVGDELEAARHFNKPLIILSLDNTTAPNGLIWLNGFHQIQHQKNGRHIDEIDTSLRDGDGKQNLGTRQPVEMVLDDELNDLPWLADRAVQAEDFEVQFLSHIKNPPGKPFLVVLHGNENQGTEKFQQALVNSHAVACGSRNRLVGSSAGCRFVTVKTHHVSHCSAEDLRNPQRFRGSLPRRLAICLPGGVRSSLPEVMGFLQSSPALHVFCFRYWSSEVSKRSLRRFLDTFVTFWNDDALEMQRDTFCMAVLSLTHRPKKKRAVVVEKLPARMSRKCPDIELTVLEALNDVALGDAQAWVTIPQVKLAIQKFRLDEDALCDHILQTYGPRERLPMQELASVLKEALFLTRS